MYSLDINFLKDRPDLQRDSGKRSRQVGTRQPVGSMVPLFAGVAIGLILPLAVGGMWFFLNQQTADLEERQADLDRQLASLQKIEDQIKQVEGETQQVNADTNTLASVFNQIKPWSAMLQDLRERIPPGVQIKTIQQSEVVAVQPNAAPAAAQTPPVTTTKLEITGTARTYNDVNDFLLTLQRSSFLKANETQVVSAQLTDNPTQFELPKTQEQSSPQAKVTIELPKVVTYRIQTSLNDVPASDLLRELERKGAVGLVTRIRTLQSKGVIQP